jgi:hypothetical protein
MSRHGRGPRPYTRWLNAEEYEQAMAICSELKRGVIYEGCTCERDPQSDWRCWQFLILPANNPAHEIVIALPEKNGPWGIREHSAFAWTIRRTVDFTDRGCASCGRDLVAHIWNATFEICGDTWPITYGLCQKCQRKVHSSPAAKRTVNRTIDEFLRESWPTFNGGRSS